MKLLTQFKDKILLSNKKLKMRYSASKVTLITFSLVFFLNYFFVGLGFKLDFFLPSLSFTYMAFIVSLVLFLFFAITIFSEDNKILKYIGIAFLVILYILALVIFYVPKELITNLI